MRGIGHLGEVAGEEGAELDEGVVALVEQLPHQLQVVRFSLLASLHFTNITLHTCIYKNNLSKVNYSESRSDIPSF